LVGDVGVDRHRIFDSLLAKRRGECRIESRKLRR
jgi:hypothetical protein